MTEPDNPREYVPVYTALGQLNGEMIRLMLEAQGFHAILSQESAGSTWGFTVGPLSEVTVLVPASEEKEARTVLQAMEEGRLEPPPNPSPTPAENKYKNKKSNKFPPEETIKNR